MYNCPMRFWFLHSVIALWPHGFGPAGGARWGEVRGLRVLSGVLVVASGEETQPAGAGGSAWRKYTFRRHQDQPSVPVRQATLA